MAAEGSWIERGQTQLNRGAFSLPGCHAWPIRLPLQYGATLWRELFQRIERAYNIPDALEHMRVNHRRLQASVSEK